MGGYKGPKKDRKAELLLKFDTGADVWIDGADKASILMNQNEE